MNERRVPWQDIPWEAGNHPLEMKKVAPGQPCTLLRFLPGFADPNMCQRSHVLHVLEGVLTIEHADGLDYIAAGETYVLSPGTSHRARNDAPAELLVLAISDISWS